MCFDGPQQVLCNAAPLPLRSHGHAPEVTFSLAPDLPPNCADNCAGLIGCDEYSHLRKPIANSLWRQNRVSKALGSVASAIGLKGRFQAIENPRCIAWRGLTH